MTFERRISCLSRFDRRVIAFEAMLLALAILLAPAPIKPGSIHVIERYEEGATRAETSELFRIYSVVRNRADGLSDNTAWSVSKTILQESRRHSIDPLLVLAVIAVESGFQHTAISSYGARGLMQIRPFVADEIAGQRQSLRQGDKPSDKMSYDKPDLDNPIVNIKLGVFYLHSLWQSFRDLKLALAAYNQGPTDVKNRLEEEEDVSQEYALKVLAAYQGYRRGGRRSG
jgi:soluble lytic murein transglycosylase-like protein